MGPRIQNKDLIKNLCAVVKKLLATFKEYKKTQNIIIFYNTLNVLNGIIKKKHKPKNSACSSVFW